MEMKKNSRRNLSIGNLPTALVRALKALLKPLNPHLARWSVAVKRFSKS